MKKHQVRIVGGHYRGTRILVPEAAHLRPTPDRVRETLFNWISHFWAGDFSTRRVLDPFAGSGALGFEAASRGAAHVELIDLAPAALASLRALKARLQADTVHVRGGDARAFLHHLTQPSYDLLLLDPPFGAGWLDRLHPLLSRALVPGGLLYLESESTLHLPPPWHILRLGRAGQVHYGLAQFAATQENGNNAPMAASPTLLKLSESA